MTRCIESVEVLKVCHEMGLGWWVCGRKATKQKASGVLLTVGEVRAYACRRGNALAQVAKFGRLTKP